MVQILIIWWNRSISSLASVEHRQRAQGPFYQWDDADGSSLMPHSLHVSGLLPSISSHPKKQATHQINKYAKLAWFLAWPRCFYGRSTCCSWWSTLFSARRAMAAWVSSLVGQSLQAFHLSSLLELQWGSTKWLSRNCCQILRFVGPTQRMKKHHWVVGTWSRWDWLQCVK